MTEMRMSEIIVKKAFTELEPNADKRTVIMALAKSLVSARKLAASDVEEVVEGAMAREAIGSTGIGHGIAIPHCRTPLVKKIVCAYGRAPQGVDFDSLDGENVHSVFLLLTPPEFKEQHLQLMKNFASQIRKENFCEFLHQNSTTEGVIELLQEFENR
ncbi:MAG: PTS sugar transporter subunit IIA [Planctomycetota bacterium]|nr:MAG: PTS sugar transporter subunit IIA [Planctomycetota bacterium]